MSNEPLKKRDESESADDDVIGHRYVSDAPDEEDPEKRKKRRSELSDDDDPGKRKK